MYLYIFIDIYLSFSSFPLPHSPSPLLYSLSPPPPPPLLLLHVLKHFPTCLLVNGKAGNFMKVGGVFCFQRHLSFHNSRVIWCHLASFILDIGLRIVTIVPIVESGISLAFEKGVYKK